jgi:UDP-2,3-diacylglucosamine pyrophosphatase LpxH
MRDGVKQGKCRARTLFLSDIHLGYRRARARELAEFLGGVQAERIVLVGDILDVLSLGKRLFWTAAHTEILRLLLAHHRAGGRLVYLPGNHDASVALVADFLQDRLEVHREWVYRTARGARLLVVHGDQLESAVGCPGWLYKLGDAMYEAALGLDHAVNALRRLGGGPRLPIVERMKLAIPTSARYIARYEQAAARYAVQGGYDGIVCGHIHRARLCRIEGVIYANTGDWVESCSALIEDERGELQLRRWSRGEPWAYRLPSPGLADAA